jgi:hypothetical protein
MYPRHVSVLRHGAETSQGGQGGGAVRLHTDVEVIVEGRVSADGEDNACVQVERYGEKDLKIPPYKISVPAGGGGSGNTCITLMCICLNTCLELYIHTHTP